jgi:hypothetical protein
MRASALMYQHCNKKKQKLSATLGLPHSNDHNMILRQIPAQYLLPFWKIYTTCWRWSLE